MRPRRHARTSLYYSNLNHVSFAPLAGADGGDLNTSGGVLSEAEGTALDPAHGRIYWDDARSGTISFANLDGSGGGGTVNTAGATITESFGLAIDPIARRVYWANCEADNYVIAYADLDGGGGHNLATPGASVACPEAVAVDPSAGLIYWINDEGSARGVVSYAHLDGSGGKDIVRLGGIPPSGPAHLLTVAVDPVNRRVWWTNAYTSTLGSSNLDGSGQSTLPIAPNIATPVGVALDPGAGRVYWANHDSNSKTLAFAGFDGSGAGGIARGLATMNSPSFPSSSSRRSRPRRRWSPGAAPAGRPWPARPGLGSRPAPSVPVPGADALRLQVAPQRRDHPRRDRQHDPRQRRGVLPLRRDREQPGRSRLPDQPGPRGQRRLAVPRREGERELVAEATLRVAARLIFTPTGGVPATPTRTRALARRTRARR